MKKSDIIDETLVDTIAKDTGLTNRTEIINTALFEYMRKLKRDQLIAACGTIDLDLEIEDIRKNRDLGLERQRELDELFEQWPA